MFFQLLFIILLVVFPSSIITVAKKVNAEISSLYPFHIYNGRSHEPLDAGEYLQPNGDVMLVKYFSKIRFNDGDDYLIIHRGKTTIVRFKLSFKDIKLFPTESLSLLIKPMLVPSYHSNFYSRSEKVSPFSITITSSLLIQNKGIIEFEFPISFEDIRNLHSETCQSPAIYFGIFLSSHTLEREFFGSNLSKLPPSSSSSVASSVASIPRNISLGQFLGRSSVIQLMFENTLHNFQIFNYIPPPPSPSSLLPSKTSPILMIPMKSYRPNQKVWGLLKNYHSKPSKSSITLSLRSKYTKSIGLENILLDSLISLGNGVWKIEFKIPVLMPPSPYFLKLFINNEKICTGHVFVAERIKVIQNQAYSDLIIPVVNSSYISSQMELRLIMISMLKDEIVGRKIEDDIILASIPFIPDAGIDSVKVKMQRSIQFYVFDCLLLGNEKNNFILSLVSIFNGSNELIIASSDPFSINTNRRTRDNSEEGNPMDVPMTPYFSIHLSHKLPNLPLSMGGFNASGKENARMAFTH